MLGFMDYVQDAWYASTRWDADNGYGSLTATARALLDFGTPVGVALHCSSLASRSFANSYTLGNTGAVDGSLAYLYSSRPLLLTRPPSSPLAEDGGMQEAAQGILSRAPTAGSAVDDDLLRPLPSRSPDVPLRAVIHGYRELPDLRQPEQASAWELWQGGRRIDVRDTLLYGRLYLPQARLEALYLRRLSPTAQLKVACVSSSQLMNGGSILFLLQRDLGKVSTEYLYSTDGGLFGIRGLYNFGLDPHGTGAETNEGVSLAKDTDDRTGSGSGVGSGDIVTQIRQQQPNGRFSAGAELYYGALNKTGGMSLGCRFATLPRHRGFPYTMTLTLNPLMGNLSSTYAVKAGPALALATRFDFNVYSYESEWQVGFELWKKKQQREPLDGSSSSSAGGEAVQWAVDRLRESERRGWITERTAEAAGKMMGGLEPEDASTARPDLSAANGSGALAAGQTDGLGRAVQPLRLRDEDTAGVLKARVNQQGVLGVLWEGRVKQLLYTFGLHVDFQQREQIFRGVGIEFHYST